MLINIKLININKFNEDWRCYLMRKGHNPTREQKEFLKKNKKNWEEWLLIKTDKDTFHFKHKVTNEIIKISKDGKIVAESNE